MSMYPNYPSPPPLYPASSVLNGPQNSSPAGEPPNPSPASLVEEYVNTLLPDGSSPEAPVTNSVDAARVPPIITSPPILTVEDYLNSPYNNDELWNLLPESPYSKPASLVEKYVDTLLPDGSSPEAPVTNSVDAARVPLIITSPPYPD